MPGSPLAFTKSGTFNPSGAPLDYITPTGQRVTLGAGDRYQFTQADRDAIPRVAGGIGAALNDFGRTVGVALDSWAKGLAVGAAGMLGAEGVAAAQAAGVTASGVGTGAGLGLKLWEISKARKAGKPDFFLIHREPLTCLP